MFDKNRGKMLADRVYKRVLEREDVALWYEQGYYDIEGCWDRAATEVTDVMRDDDLTDLMAWVISEQDFYWTAWNDGFGYLFGSLLASRYEDENFEEE